MPAPRGMQIKQPGESEDIRLRERQYRDNNGRMEGWQHGSWQVVPESIVHISYRRTRNCQVHFSVDGGNHPSHSMSHPALRLTLYDQLFSSWLD